jgi:hypothetical protein
MMPIQKEDIVVLVFSNNSNLTDLVRIEDIKEKDFKVDLEKMTWSYNQLIDIPIGNARKDLSEKTGIIGVYDQRNLDHIKNIYKDLNLAIE